MSYPRNPDINHGDEDEHDDTIVSRFDYVKYDDKAQRDQGTFKSLFQDVEQLIDTLPNGRAKALAYTHLEESYMWVGKALRDEQITRNGSAPLSVDRAPPVSQL